MIARLEALRARREALVAQSDVDRKALGAASRALVGPLALVDLARDTVTVLRAPPPFVTWGERILRLLLQPGLGVALRYGWYGWKLVGVGRRAYVVVRRSEAALGASSAPALGASSIPGGTPGGALARR